MTELSGKLARVIKVHGVEAPVVMEMDESGITFRVQWTQKRLMLSWTQAVSHSETPSNVPSFLMGKPYEFLKYAGIKQGTKKAGKQ